MAYQPELTERSPLVTVWAQAAARWGIGAVVAFAFFLLTPFPITGNVRVLVSLAIGVGASVASTPLGLYWLRNYLIRSTWMLLLFAAALLVPWLIWQGPALEQIDPWRYLVIALLAWTLYWVKHPTQHVRAAAIGSLVWIGFNVGVVIPGLGDSEQRRAEELASAVDQGLCVPSEDQSCSAVPYSAYVGVVILGYALNLASEGEFVRAWTRSESGRREERGRGRDLNDSASTGGGGDDGD